MSNILPGFKSPIGEPDLQILGEVLVKHYLFLQSREEKQDFIKEVSLRFYETPMTKFSDELANFSTVIGGSSTFYNDALLFVMAVVSELVFPEAYFKKLLAEYKSVISGMPNNATLSHRITEKDYFACVFFALRYYVDQLDLFVPELPPTENAAEGK